MAPEKQEPTGGLHFGDLQLGLKTIADDQTSLSSSCVTRKLLSSAQLSLASTSSYCSSLSSSSSFSSLSSLGLDADKNAAPEEEKEEEEEEEACWGTYGTRDGFRKFPPPISIPRVLMRKYNEDGRLVIQVVTIKHHEFLWSHRSNGRLTLKSIHMHINSPDVVKKEREEDGKITNLIPPSPSSQQLLFSKDEDEDGDEDDIRRILYKQINPRRKRAANEVRQKYSMGGESASSMPESTMMGNGCFMNRRSAASLMFQIPVKS